MLTPEEFQNRIVQLTQILHERYAEKIALCAPSLLRSAMMMVLNQDKPPTDMDQAAAVVVALIKQLPVITRQQPEGFIPHLSQDELLLNRLDRTLCRVKQYTSGFYYWLSWVEHSSMGPCELHFPNWITGDGPRGIISRVAAVTGSDVNDVMEFIRQSYDNPPPTISFQFVSFRSDGWSGFGDRYPMAPWMVWMERTPSDASTHGYSGNVSPTVHIPGCSISKMNAGCSAPKTCINCGLGPCKHGLTHKKRQAEALNAVARSLEGDIATGINQFHRTAPNGEA